MYIEQEYRCECGAVMFKRPVANHRELVAVTCMARLCGMHGITRYVKLTEVPEASIVPAPAKESVDG